MKKFEVFLFFLVFDFVVEASEYKVYFGNIHAHCEYSDGKGTALEAYIYARDVAKLHFFSLTDHMEQLTPDELSETIRAAEETRIEGIYETLWGFEWGSPIYNHSNMFMTERFYSVDCYVNDRIKKFYAELIRYPPVIMQFNHPDYNPNLPMYNYHQYEYNKDVDKLVSLIEIKSAFDKDDRHEMSYIQALDKGWHLSPVCNQDNHDSDWGSKNGCRVAVWLPSLTRESLIEGLKRGRTYSTWNQNVIVKWLCDGRWAGETVFTKEMVHCELIVSDPDETDMYTSVEVITTGGKVYKTINDF
ncbi:MAG: hypothetical protein N2746_04515 [Deltaproteobacteria bacterium]|nr:hypothetical protein [Deltaproteobacteria bacterium]